MPIYEYQCRRCGHRVEAMQRIADPPLKKCPECGGALKKLVSAPAFQFKGTGWYVTDYAGKGKAEPKEAGEAKGEAKADGKAEAGSGKAAGEGKASPAKGAKESAGSGKAAGD